MIQAETRDILRDPKLVATIGIRILGQFSLSPSPMVYQIPAIVTASNSSNMLPLLAHGQGSSPALRNPSA